MRNYENVRNMLKAIAKKDPQAASWQTHNQYKSVKKKIPITVEGRRGNLVVDHSTWNDLWYEDPATGKRYILETQLSDKEMEDLITGVRRLLPY